SLSTNAVQIKRLAYQDIWPGAISGRVDYLRDSFSFVPNFFGIIQRQKDRSAFAFTISTLDNEAYDQRNRIDLAVDVTLVDGVTTAATTEIINTNFNYTNTMQEVGFATAGLLGKDISIGGGLFLDYQDQRRIQQDNLRLKDFDYFQTLSLYHRKQVISLRPSLGTQVALTDKLTFGYAATIAVPLFGVYTSQSTSYYSKDARLNASYVFADALALQDSVTTTDNILSSGLFQSTFLKNSLGLAYFASRSLLFSLDACAYLPIESSVNPESRVFSWNAAGGVELYVTPYFPLRLGLFTNNANTPQIAASASNQKDHLDMYGASLSFGYSTADFSISVGTVGSLGWGKAQILANDASIQNLTGENLQVFISGGYQY
ncbi:MAG: hypothetical protein WCL50_17155, partial [Spirochaetota bacterium]